MGDVAYACDEVDIAVAEVAACIGLLSQPELEDHDTAVKDAHLALRRICAVLDNLRSSCQRARDSMHDSLTQQPFDPVARTRG